MRVLVTGAAGFVGSHVCQALVDAGEDVIGVDCFTEYYGRRVKEANLASLLGRRGFTFREADLRTAALQPIVTGVDAVINEAAMPGLVYSWQNFDAYASCNLHTVHRLVEACQGAGVARFIQASTSSVYGDDAVGAEDSPTRPVSPYGVTKLAAENLLMAHATSFGFPAIILRYFSIYGPRQRPDMAYHRFIQALNAGEEIIVYGDGGQSRSNTYVDDCVRGTIAALHHGEPGETYNLGGGEVITLLQAIDLIAEATGGQPRLRFEAARPGDQRHTCANVAKARQQLGYQPEILPREGLRRQADWQKQAAI